MKKYKIGIILVFFSLFFLSRSLKLEVFPLFEDEAAYINFASLAKSNFFAHWSESYRLGLGPVFPNIAALVMRFTTDPVVAGRLATAIFSLLSFYAVGILAETIFDKPAAWFARVLYLVVPYAFLYDRLAMLDSMALAFSLLAMICFIRLAQRKYAYWLPALLSLYLAVLTKPTGFLAFALGPVISLTLGWEKRWSKRQFFSFMLVLLTIELAALTLIAATIATAFGVFVPVYNRVVSTKSSVPGWFIRENAHKALLWIEQYTSTAFLGLAFLGGLLAFWKRPKYLPVLGIWIGVIYILSLFVSKFWYPRYILPGVPLLVLLASYPLSLLWSWSQGSFVKRLILAVGLLVLVVPMMRNDYLLAFKPQEAMMPAEDRVLYFEIWTSGVYADRAKEFFKKRLTEEKDIVIFTDTMKIAHVGITISLQNENSRLKGRMLRQLTFPSGSLPAEVFQAALAHKKVYLVFTRYPYPPDEWGLKNEATYKNNFGQIALRIDSLTIK